MKRFAVLAAAVVVLCLSSGAARASWGSCTYSGYQPWWNIFAHRNKCLTPEEERLQKFWHDYYHALKCYYDALDNIDWVAYYKNHGYQINGGCGPYGGPCGRINYAPVFVSPVLQWAVPHQALQGPYNPGVPGGMGGPGGPGGFGPGPYGAFAAPVPQTGAPPVINGGNGQ